MSWYNGEWTRLCQGGLNDDLFLILGSTSVEVHYINDKAEPGQTRPSWAMLSILSFEELNSAVARNLPYRQSDVSFEPKVYSANCIRYELSTQREGFIGAIWVRVKSERWREIYFEAPRYPPRRNWTPDEEAWCKSRPDHEARHQALIALSDKMRAERDTYYTGAVWAFTAVTSEFLTNFWADRKQIEELEATWSMQPGQPTITTTEATQPARKRATTGKLGDKPGRPELDRDVLIDRLMRAQDAEALRARNPKLYWATIAHAVKWPLGTRPSAVKVLEKTRKLLRTADPATLAAIDALRNKLKEKN